MKKSTEESSAVQQRQAGKMYEIDLESLFRDFFFMWAVDVAGTFIYIVLQMILICTPRPLWKEASMTTVL